MDNFGDHPQKMLVYVLFVLATFISQLTMLNMLIAIMGDSFDKVIENKEVNGIIMKLEILNDLSAVLPQKDTKEEDETILIVAKSEDADEDEDNEWEGTLRRLTRVVEGQSSIITKSLGQKVDKLQETIQENAKKDHISDR